MDAPNQAAAGTQLHDKEPKSEKAPIAAETKLIEFKTSPIHGTGGFAKGGIRKATRVIEYLGEKISKSESVRRCEANNP